MSGHLGWSGDPWSFWWREVIFYMQILCTRPANLRAAVWRWAFECVGQDMASNVPASHTYGVCLTTVASTDCPDWSLTMAGKPAIFQPALTWNLGECPSASWGLNVKVSPGWVWPQVHALWGISHKKASTPLSSAGSGESPALCSGYARGWLADISWAKAQLSGTCGLTKLDGGPSNLVSCLTCLSECPEKEGCRLWPQGVEKGGGARPTKA